MTQRDFRGLPSKTGRSHFLPRTRSWQGANSATRHDWQSSWPGLLDSENGYLTDFKQTLGTLGRGRFIGQQLPYPGKRAVLRQGAASSLAGRGVERQPELKRERWRTNEARHMSPTLLTLFVRCYSTGSEVKTKPLPPLFYPVWTSCRSDRQSGHPPPCQPS